MMKKYIIIALVVLFTSTGFAQKSLNDYKYVIVPNKFEFFKEADKYQLNSLSKFLFNKYGFKAYLKDEELPIEALKNRCLVLNADVSEKRTMFKTKLAVQLKNCNGDIVYTTPQGESRKKEYKVAYNQALRNAFKIFNTLNYKYVENKSAFSAVQVDTKTEDSKTEIEQLKQEIKTLKEDKKEATVKTLEKPKSIEVKPKDIKINDNQLYAQATNYGFQLVDKTPKVIYTIIYSGKKDIFIVKGRDAIIHKVNGIWTISEFKNDSLVAKALEIKF